MINQFRIKPHYSIVAHSVDCVELRSGIWNPSIHTLNDEQQTGKLYSIINCLDGTMSTKEVAQVTGAKRSDVESLIDYLQTLNVLEMAADNAFQYYLEVTSPATFRSYYVENEIKPKYPLFFLGDEVMNETLRETLQNAFIDHSISIEQTDAALLTLLSQPDEKWLHDALEYEKVLAQFSHLQNKFIIFTQREINPIVARRINSLAHGLNVPWIHVALDGPFLLVGPIFTGNSGPCYNCFETRVSMNLRENATYETYKKALAEGKVVSSKSSPVEGILTNLLTAHASLEILNFLLTEAAFIKHKVLAIYLPTMEISYNEVLRLSGCAVCGSLRKRDDTQLYFDFHALLEGATV